MRGVKSFAMVLCVSESPPDKALVELRCRHFRRPLKMGKRVVSRYYSLRRTPSQVTEYISRALNMKVRKRLILSQENVLMAHAY